MPASVHTLLPASDKSWLDRALTPFTDVRSGEGVTAVLMLVNIFLLLICYSVIKTVREPLILLGGGAEVRSYAAAGQALLLMGFVPLYSWCASRVDRVKLLVGVTLFFIVCIELFAGAVAAQMPYVGVAFFIWVGIFNISLVAQFWSFANDIYSKGAGERLFPIIVMGMTAGAPVGSFVAGRLFHAGFTPQVILQISAALLSASVFLYLRINARETRREATVQPMSAAGGFRLVLTSGYLRLVALLIVLLNVVNTTGEYVVARLLTNHANEMALADATFNKQAYIGAFTGDYQFWVNVTALMIQLFITSRLVKYKGLQGALLALPLIALGGYAMIAAGAGFSMVRWIKTAENATDYSVMNTARQLLWLPRSREEKYKAKQAIDTFFMRGGDLLSAAVVYLGTRVLQLEVPQFGLVNIALTLAWIGVALLILQPSLRRTARPLFRPATAIAVGLMLVALAAPAAAQDTREAQLAAERAEKATRLKPYEPEPLERRIEKVEEMLLSKRPVYTFIGSAFHGGGLAVGPGYRMRFADSGSFDAHAAWSVRNYKVADAALTLPAFAGGRITASLRGNWLDAPRVAFYGVGGDTRREDRTDFAYRATTIGVSTRMQAAPHVAVGGGVDAIDIVAPLVASPAYRRTSLFGEVDWRTSPDYTRSGGFYRVDWSDYHQTSAGAYSFRRVDAEVNQFVPILRENWVIALRAAVSSTDAAPGQDVPAFLMPDLGGSHSLRGYPAWRFRDRNRLLLTGEYRWTAGPFADMALFVDAGKVAPRAADLDLRNLRKSYGLGVSFHTSTATLARIEVARSREGSAVSLSFSPSF